MNRLPSAPRRHWLALAAASATGLAAPWPRVAYAQDAFPARPIALVVPFPPGGTTDILGRLVAKELGDRLKASVVVENKAGAGGGIGTALVGQAAPDGHTLLMGTIGTHTINPFLYKKLAYDAFKDFTPVALVALVPNVLVVHPSVPANTVAEFIAYAKANPGKVAYASAGNGTSIHLSGAMFEQFAQVQMQHVPYKGSAPAVADLLSGQTQCMFDNLPSSLPHIKAGKLRALAVTSTERAAALPDAPTLAEAGVAGYSASSWFGVWAPAGTPAAVVARLNEAIQAFLTEPASQEALQKLGAKASPGSPAQFQQFIDAEAAKWSKVVKAAHVQLD